MLKHLLMLTMLLVASRLPAETIGNVEFQFPPSKYEWKLFVDYEFFHNLFDCDDCYDDDDENEEEVPPQIKMFAHREGDSVEFFTAIQVAGGRDDEEESKSLDAIQSSLDTTINTKLANHRLVVLSYEDLEDGALCEWELHDGNTDIMHGYSRCIEKDSTITIIGYLTTAIQSECNRSLWTHVLNQAK